MRTVFPALLLLALLMAGCAVGPDYRRPPAAAPAVYKEGGDWVPAAPSDAIERGAWWTLFNDPVLNDLAARVRIDNQNVAAATAAYAQARALVAEQRAALFPLVTLDGGATRSGGGDRAAAGNYQFGLGASWEPDVFGRLRRAAAGAQAGAQASAADLASATLAAQGELAANYVALRATDAQRALLAATIEGYRRIVQITRNRYNVGLIAKTDLLQAQTQLSNAMAEEAGLARQRAQLEHAIAVLVGRAPAEFSLAPQPWTASVPDIPAGVPSTLLQRRPDIAAAERRMAAANEQIGIAQSAWFPNLRLSASYGYGASRLGDLFKASGNVWSLGLSLGQTLLDFGETRARVQGARAGYDEAVARYRQSVLSAFQDVEDQLAAVRVLARQETLRREASSSADLVETQVMNRYDAGQVGFAEVVQAQATALSARRALVQAQADRKTAAVALVQALGGGWQSGPP